MHGITVERTLKQCRMWAPDNNWASVPSGRYAHATRVRRASGESCSRRWFGTRRRDHGTLL